MKSLTFIAGGSKGLGAALLHSFQLRNHEVYELSRTNNNPQHINCDFNQPTEANTVFNNTFASHLSNNYQSINLVINTATLTPFGSISSATYNELNRHININIESTLLLLQSFISTFQNTNSKKTISYISSGAARRAIPGLAMYSASKAFFERFIDTLAEEQKSTTCPFNCMIINPGVMNTDMQSEIRAQSIEDFPMVGSWIELHKSGQLANPVDVASVCTDLILKTGVNGGYYTAQNLLNPNKK